MLHRWGSGTSEEVSLGKRLQLELEGEGGTPLLVVNSSILDFGTVMLEQDNSCLLRVNNQGVAEGSIAVEVNHPQVVCRMAAATGESDFMVPPNSYVDIQVLFHPLTLEDLNAIMIVSSKHQTIRHQIQVNCDHFRIVTAIASFVSKMFWY